MGHTCALTTAGAVKCWGWNSYGQLGDGGTNTDQSTPVAVSGLSSGVAAITAGYGHTCAITTVGAVRCWGYDVYGQLGDGGTNTDQSTPVAVSGLSSGVTGIAAGYGHTCARTNAGAVRCWGYDDAGQLGDGGANTDQPTPVAVSGLSSGVTAIATGAFHTCVLTNAGTAKCWGWDGHGQLGDGGSNTDQSTPVTVSAPSTPTPTPAGLALVSPTAVRCGVSNTLTGTGFSPGSVVKAFIAFPGGVEAVGPYVPTSLAPTSLTWTLPCSVGLGNGFIALQVINTDQNYISSNIVPALLRAGTSSGYPSITGINGVSVTAAHASFPLAHVQTVVSKGVNIAINGTGFAVPAKVNLFTASGNAGPLDTLPGSTSTELLVQIPPTAPTGPGAVQVVNPSGAWPSSNAVSVPLGATISISSITQQGSTITVNGSGFSSLSVINFFTPSANHCGMAAGAAVCPLTLVSDQQFTVQRPPGTGPGRAFIEVLNPPFIPFSSTGTDPDGAFTLP